MQPRPMSLQEARLEWQLRAYVDHVAVARGLPAEGDPNVEGSHPNVDRRAKRRRGQRLLWTRAYLEGRLAGRGLRQEAPELE